MGDMTKAKPKMTAAQYAAIHMSVPHKDIMTGDDLIGVLRGEIDWQPWRSHLSVFFQEMLAEEIQEVMDENNLTFEQLSVVYDAIHEAFKGPIFKAMRDEAMGRPLS
jgi:hypothetical protein